MRSRAVVEGAERISEGGVGRYGGARRDGDASFRFVRTRVGTGQATKRRSSHGGWRGVRCAARAIVAPPQSTPRPHHRTEALRHSARPPEFLTSRFGSSACRPGARARARGARRRGARGRKRQADKARTGVGACAPGPGSGSCRPCQIDRPAQQTVGDCVTSPNRMPCRRAAECSPSSSLLVCGPPVCLLVVTANNDGVYTCQ